MKIIPRIIPALLLADEGFVKTVAFSGRTYLGDPINIVKIFNDKEVDEIAILDIDASPARRGPRIESLRHIVTECFVPILYGGGITSLSQMEALFNVGIEKAAINSEAHRRPALISEAAREFGSQSVVVSIDVAGGRATGWEVAIESGRIRTGQNPSDVARRAENLGAGELLVTSIDRDGTRSGYDLDLIRAITAATHIPVIACGGAASAADLVTALTLGRAAGAAAGSLFVFQGRRRAVLINVPGPSEIAALLESHTPRPGSPYLQEVVNYTNDRHTGMSA